MLLTVLCVKSLLHSFYNRKFVSSNPLHLLALNDMLDWMNLIDIYRTFRPKAAEYTCFSRARGTFSRRVYMLGHKTSPNVRKLKSHQAAFPITCYKIKKKKNHQKKT